MKTLPTLFLLALSLALLTGCKPRHTDPLQAANQHASFSAQHVQAQRQTLRPTHTLPGMTIAKTHATLAARVMGQVSAVHVTMGDAVAEGDILVEIHAPELVARVKQAETALQRAERNHRREQTLLERGASLPETLNDLAEQVAIARASLAEVQALQTFASIKAPFAGVVTQRMIEPGDLAAPASPLLTIESPQAFQVELQVPESLPMLEPGEFVGIRLGEEFFEAQVAEVSPATNTAAHARWVKLDLPQEYERGSGRYVTVLWPGAPFEGLLTPRSAIVQTGQLEHLYIIKDGRAQMRVVRTAGAFGDQVQIQAGLQGGELVVVNPSPALRHGQQVEIQP